MANEKRGIDKLETVALDDVQGALVILDQTKLPGEVKYLALKDTNSIREAIYSLKVRGAPAIGVAAAIGVYLAAASIETDSYREFLIRFRQAKAKLASARPTAVNLSWALERMERIVTEHPETPVAELKALLRREAILIREEDELVCRKIGENGLKLLRDGCGILTHCNAGMLATTRYGTALAPIHLGREKGMNFRVYADETRPLLQGARLTAFELVEDGVDTTLICDNMASQVMKSGLVNVVMTGCDRVAMNGDACNKIGTSGLAVLAKHYGIPFYVLGPVSTIDPDIKDGKDIPIERRPAEEVTEVWYSRRMAPEGVKVYNPAFDVTDNSLITAIVTEYGIAYPPYGESLGRFVKKAGAARPMPC